MPFLFPADFLPSSHQAKHIEQGSKGEKDEKILSMLLTLTLLIGLLSGCGGNQNTGNQTNDTANTTSQNDQESTDNAGENDSQESGATDETGEETRTADPNKTSIVFGITSGFVDFTDYIPEMMAEWGYDVEIKVLDSPVVADTALAEGSIDANYIQHLPYLLAFNESNGTNLYPCEPYIMSSMDCIASLKYSSLDEVPDGATIAVADDASNLSVNLEDLASIGWLTLAEIPEGSSYTTFDILENPKNLQLIEMDMATRFAAMEGDVDLAMGFYTNTAQAKYNFNLLKLFDENIAYPQVVAVREEDKDAQWVEDLMAAMTSEAQVERINAKNDPNLAWKILFPQD